MMKLEELPTSSKMFDCREGLDPWYCNLCRFSSHVLSLLIQHKEEECGNKMDISKFLVEGHKCGYCEFISCSCITMSRHECRMLGEASCANDTSLWICSHCDCTTSYKSLNDKFECGGEECNYTCTRIEELKQHATFVHLSDECLKYFFANKGALKAELETHRINEHSLVFVSKVEYNRREELSVHEMSRHVVKKHRPPLHRHSATEDIKRFECEQCEYTAKYKRYLNRHVIRNHTPIENIKWFECEECEFKTKRRPELRDHAIRIHTPTENMQWFVCECGYKGKTKGALKRHTIGRHGSGENIRWRECQECSYKAKTKNSLKLHTIRKHTLPEKMKWFVCEECGYKSKAKGDLKTHTIRKHTPAENIKWLVCECGYKCIARRDMNVHKKSVKHKMAIIALQKE